MIGKGEEKMKATINKFVTIVLVGVVLSLLVGVSGATWCDTDFAKRVNVSVNNTAGSALTNYQVYVNLSANPINETSLRVYNSTSCMLRSHWTENETSGNSYGVWINYSSIAAGTWTNNTAIYYDNTTVSSASDGTNTFEFFDDFETEEWEKYSGNPVLNPSSGSERFDSGYVFEPHVLKVDSEYWMYYCGGLAPNIAKRDNIGLAISTDLNNWTKYNGSETNQSIVYSGGVGDFDEDRAWFLSGGVIRESATSWKMWYLGDSDTGAGHIGRVGYATSTDGKNWTKYSGSGYGNSIFEDMNTSSKGISDCTILKEGDTDYKMMYTSFTAGYDSTDMRYATSSDGINWTIQNSGTPVIYNHWVTYMININGTYYLWTNPNTVDRITLFTSTDLISWTNEGTQLSIGGTGEWDSIKLYGGSIFEDTPGVWCMFFNAHDSVNICNGYATLEKTLPVLDNKWTTTNSPVDYTSTNDFWSGTQSMQIGVTNDGGDTQCILAASEDIAISMRLKTTTSDYFLVLHGDSSTNINIVFMTDLLQYYDAGWVGTHSAPHGNWYKLTMKDIDYTANTYDICLGDDETVIYDSVNMHNAGDYDGIIRMYNGDDPGIAYVDNVYARKYTSTEPSTTLGSEEDAPSTTPVISNVVNGSISPTSQWIDWDVNQTAHNRVLYSNESDLTPAYYSSWQNSTNAPNITLSGLDASTQYWYQVWSYNTTNTSLSDNSSTLSFTTTSVDTSFTVTLPSGYTHLKFEPSNSTAQNVTPNGQTDSQEFYNVTNTGNVNLDIRLQLNETVSNILLKADTDNNPLGAKEVNTTLVIIYSNLATSNSADIWLWSDFSHTVEQDTNKTINVNVTQSA